MCKSARSIHAVRAIDGNDPKRRSARRSGDIRPRERGGKEQQGGHASREQQQITKPAPLRTRDWRLAEQPHGSERYGRRNVATQEVQHDRNRDRKAAEQKCRKEEAHVVTSSATAPTNTTARRSRAAAMNRAARSRCRPRAARGRSGGSIPPARAGTTHARRPDPPSPRLRSRRRETATAHEKETSARADRAPGTRRRRCHGISNGGGL